MTDQVSPWATHDEHTWASWLDGADHGATPEDNLVGDGVPARASVALEADHYAHGVPSGVPVARRRAWARPE